MVAEVLGRGRVLGLPPGKTEARVWGRPMGWGSPLVLGQAEVRAGPGVLGVPPLPVLVVRGRAQG